MPKRTDNTQKAVKAPARMSKKDPLTREQLHAIDAWWRAANYLSACQLYLLDNPLLHDNDLVGNTHGFLLIMGDENSGDLRCSLNLADLLPCLQPQPGIQVGERLVQQEYMRHFYQGTGDGDALLLSA